MITAHTGVRCVRYGLWKAHPAVPKRTMIDWDDVRYFTRRRARRLSAGCRRAPGSESLDRAATHRSARGTPRGADVRKAAFGLPPDGCGRRGPRVREPDGSVVAPAGDAGLRSRPERARASAGDAGTVPRDTPPHAGIRRLRAYASGHRDGNPVIRRGGKSDQPGGRCRNPLRL